MTFGGGGKFQYVGNSNQSEATRMVAIALDSGVNMLDCSDAYSTGLAEETVGETVKGKRNQVLLATKARFRGFDMRIIYNDVQRDPAFEAETGAEYLDKETLLREADFLTLHVPLVPETHHYIGTCGLKMMEETAILINASRRPVVDEKLLVEALREKWIFGAGLDVLNGLAPENCVNPEVLRA